MEGFKEVKVGDNVAYVKITQYTDISIGVHPYIVASRTEKNFVLKRNRTDNGGHRKLEPKVPYIGGATMTYGVPKAEAVVHIDDVEKATDELLKRLVERVKAEASKEIARRQLFVDYIAERNQN